MIVISCRIVPFRTNKLCSDILFSIKIRTTNNCNSNVTISSITKRQKVFLYREPRFQATENSGLRWSSDSENVLTQ